MNTTTNTRGVSEADRLYALRLEARSLAVHSQDGPCQSFAEQVAPILDAYAATLRQNPERGVTEAMAWMTTDEEGSPSMLFFDRSEALHYCDEDEQPVPLFAALSAEPAAQGEAPLAGRWHHGNGTLCCGSFRIARADWEAGVCAAEGLRDQVFDWIVSQLNSQSAAPPAQPAELAAEYTRGRSDGWDAAKAAQPAEAVIDFAGKGEAGPFPIKNGRIELPQVTLDDLRDRIKDTAQPAERVPEGWVLVPGAFVDLVRAAARDGTHPRAVPQLLDDAMEVLAASPAQPAGRMPEEVTAWVEAKREHKRLVGVYNVRLAYAKQHDLGRVSVDHEYQAMCDQQRVMNALIEPMFDALAASPAPSPARGDGGVG